MSPKRTCIVHARIMGHMDETSACRTSGRQTEDSKLLQNGVFNKLPVLMAPRVGEHSENTTFQAIHPSESESRVIIKREMGLAIDDELPRTRCQ